MVSQQNIPAGLQLRLPELRAKHGHIYVTTVAGRVYAFRAPTWKEHTLYRERVQSDLFAVTDFVNAVLLWPEAGVSDRSEMGVFGTLANAVAKTTGFEDPQALMVAMDHYRRTLEDSIDYQLKMVICKAFPAYKPEELDNMQFLQVVELFVMAEQMLGMDHQMEKPQGGDRPPRRGRPAPHAEDTEVYGGHDDFEPIVASPPGVDPLRDPNRPPPDFEADNAFFRKSGLAANPLITPQRE